MPATLAPIELTRSNTVRPASGLRYGNFEGVSHLPPVHTEGKYSDFSSLNNQQIYKTVCEWFRAWQPWQQKMSLCGIANRCSSHQLDILATTLEPVCHRDYLTASQQRYPSASFRKVQEIHRIHLDSLPERKPEKQKSKPKDKAKTSSALTLRTPPSRQSDDKGRKRSRANSKRSSVTFAEDVKLDPGAKTESPSFSLDSFADQLASKIIETALHDVSLVIKYDQSQFLKSKSSDVQIVEPDEKGNEDSVLQNCHESDQLPVDKGSDATEDKFSEIESIDSDVQGVEILPDENLDGSLQVVGDDLEDKRNNKTILKKYMRKVPRAKFHGQKIHLKKQCEGRGGARTSSSLFRQSVFGSSAVSTLEFFSPHRAKGVPMQREIRKGPVQRPAGVTDIPHPLVRSYKEAIWWPEKPESSKVYKKAEHAELFSNFREQQSQIWEWLSLWEDYERIALLREVVKICTDLILEYLVFYIKQIIREKTDVNRLTDRTLLYIFSCLAPKEIDIAAQTCRRWRYLCATDDLWMLKCLEMGEYEGVENITGLVLAANSMSKQVDWKLAYLELKQLVKTMKHGLAIPHEIDLSADERDRKEENRTDDDIVQMKTGSTIPKVKVSTSEPVRTRGLRVTRTLIVSHNEEDSDWDSSEEDLSPFLEEYALQTEQLPPVKYNYQRQYQRMPRSFRKSKSMDLKDSLEDDNKDGDHQKGESTFPRRNAQDRDDEEDNSLDVRPTLETSVDLLGKVVPAVSLEWQITSESLTQEAARARKFAGVVDSVKRVRKLQGHMSGILCLQFDKRRLVTGGADRSIRIWDIRSGRSLHKFYGPKGGVRCLQFDDEILVTGSWDMVVMIWDMKKFKHDGSLHGHKGSVSCLQINPDRIVSGSHDGTVRVWNRRDYHCLNTLTLHRGGINSLCIDDSNVITAASDMIVKMTNMETGETVLKFELVHSQIVSLALQDCLLIGSDVRGTLFFWNKIDGETEAAVKAHDAAIHRITYRKGRVWTASGDHSVKEWDLSTMTCVRALQGHKGPVRDVKVSDDRAVTCSDDGTIRIWDFSLPKALQKQSQ